MQKPDTNAPYLLFILILSLFAVLTLAVSALAPLTPATRTILSYADTALCAVFFIDFVGSLARADKKRRYLYTWGWLDLLSSIPEVAALRWLRAARIVRVLRVLRGIRAAKSLTAFILQRRAQSAFLAATMMSLMLVVLAASMILQFETSADANIKTPGDAIWWAVVTITTVGYGDRFPLSSEGRIIATLLMTAGVGLFGTFSGFVASWFLKPAEAQRESDLERLTAEVEQLRKTVLSKL
jgi:voltage-gated potassium channel